MVLFDIVWWFEVTVAQSVFEVSLPQFLMKSAPKGVHPSLEKFCQGRSSPSPVLPWPTVKLPKTNQWKNRLMHRKPLVNQWTLSTTNCFLLRGQYSKFAPQSPWWHCPSAACVLWEPLGPPLHVSGGKPGLEDWRIGFCVLSWEAQVGERNGLGDFKLEVQSEEFFQLKQERFAKFNWNWSFEPIWIHPPASSGSLCCRTPFLPV